MLGDSDGEEVVTGVQDAPGAGAEAKKKRKNRKKKSSADEPAAPVAAMSLVVVKGIAAGFSRAAVEAAVSAMFDDGQAYDDPDAVIAKLKGASAPAKVCARVWIVTPSFTAPPPAGCGSGPSFEGIRVVCPCY